MSHSTLQTGTLTEDKETLCFVKIKNSDKKKYTALHLWSFSFKSRAPSNVQVISKLDILINLTEIYNVLCYIILKLKDYLNPCSAL